MRAVEEIPWLYEIIRSLYEWNGLAELRRWLVAGALGRVLDLASGTGRRLPKRALRPGSQLCVLEHSGFQTESDGRRAKRSHRHFAARRALVAVLTTVLTALVAPAAFAGDPFADLDVIRPRQTRPAPDFTVPRLGSGSLTLKELRGTVVFLNFWATWCPPCKAEMPSMERLYRRHKGQGFTIVALSIDTDGVEHVARFVKSLGLTFPIGLDPKSEVANRYTVRALPSSILIDRNGNTVAVALGPRDWDGPAAHAIVERLLK